MRAYVNPFLLFQSTPPVKAATSAVRIFSASSDISIHAAREGGDSTSLVFTSSPLRISIHAAREGGDLNAQGLTGESAGFQSTPPVKAATYKLFYTVKAV